MFTKLYAATWGDVGKAKEKGFFDFDLFSWMAWTWQTAAFFIFIALCITVIQRAIKIKNEAVCQVQAIQENKSKSKKPFSFALPTSPHVAAYNFVNIKPFPSQIL